MKPSRLRRGDWLAINLGGREKRAEFLRREPAQGKGRPARNVLRFPELAGFDGPDDDGTCVVSDHLLSRKGRLLEGVRFSQPAALRAEGQITC